MSVQADSSFRGLTQREFQLIRALAYEKFGLDLRPGKEQLVSARLSKKMRELNLRTFNEYYQFVLADRSGEALIGMIDALTTNYTMFLREVAHFDYLREVIAPALRDRGRIEIWSSACATGEEPYSIAFAMIEALGTDAYSKVRILATDISTKALNTAERGIYPAERFQGFPPLWMSKYMLRGEGQWQGNYRVKPEVRKMIDFQRVNLIEPLPGLHSVPVIFCRNVMIYFDKPTQEVVVTRLVSLLEPGGHLLIGHAENLTGVPHTLKYVRPAVFRKPGTDGAAEERVRSKR